jgi:F-type H+-transporting ATPase subunit delta
VARSAARTRGTHLDPGLSRRYAVALYKTADRRELVDRVETDLAATVELLAKEPALREFLLSPEVLDEHKEALVNKVLAPKVHTITLNFLLLLLKKRRFDHIAGINDSLIEQVEEHRGILRAQVITPTELRQDLRDRLETRLESMTGKTIVLESEVDPDLLGGMVVVLHNQLIDGSVRRELDRLHDELMAIRVV